MRIMQHMIRIREIAERSCELGLRLKPLCAEAGVPYESVRRWVRGDCEPSVSTYFAVVDRLEAALEARREALRAKLGEAAE